VLKLTGERREQRYGVTNEVKVRSYFKIPNKDYSGITIRGVIYSSRKTNI